MVFVEFLIYLENQTKPKLHCRKLLSLVIQLPVHKHRKKGLGGVSERLGC